MDILPYVVNYGILGVWTTYLLWEKHKLMSGLTHSLNRNTEVLEDLRHMIKEHKESEKK